jgi:hypothetical protein
MAKGGTITMTTVKDNAGKQIYSFCSLWLCFGCLFDKQGIDIQGRRDWYWALMPRVISKPASAKEGAPVR